MACPILSPEFRDAAAASWRGVTPVAIQLHPFTRDWWATLHTLATAGRAEGRLP